MKRVMILGRETDTLVKVKSELAGHGFTCSITPYGEEATEKVSSQSPDLVLAEMDGYMPGYRTKEIIRQIKQINAGPVIALVTDEALDDLGSDRNIDDFISSPYDSRELVLRIKRLLRKDETPDGEEVITCNGLIIDVARCEVTLEGRKVVLTFKEYELLKFLAANRGRVYTREKLLDEIWGMDYFGGDRTVDVHVRRLRSKIEDSGHCFIETVRNIGYRFRDK